MKAIKIIFGLLCSAIFLSIALRGIQFRALLTILANASFPPAILAAAVFLSSYAARAIRWQIMLRAVTPSAPVRPFLSAIFIGAAANNVLPLRAGEFVRAFAIKAYGGISAKTALSSIVLERILDGLSLLLLLALLLIIAPFPLWVFRMGIAASAVFGGAIAILALCYHHEEWVVRTARRLSRRIAAAKADRLVSAIERLAEGLSLFSSARNIAAATALSLGIWLLEAAVYLLVGSACGLRLPLTAVLLCLVVVNFGLIIPSSPGFVGTFEYACVIALGAFAISQTEAMGFAIVLHALFWITLVIAGLAFSWIDHGGMLALARRDKTILEASPFTHFSGASKNCPDARRPANERPERTG